MFGREFSHFFVFVALDGISLSTQSQTPNMTFIAFNQSGFFMGCQTARKLLAVVSNWATD